MHTDFAVLTGAQHTGSAVACQDYCLAGMRGPRAWAVVADGCSMGEQTDLGARAWALAARELTAMPARLFDDPTETEPWLLNSAAQSLRDLEFDDGYSTLAVLAALDGQVRASFYGDGALLARKLDGSMLLINLQFTGNAPRYLNYLRRPEKLAQWREQYPGQELLVTTNLYDPDGELASLKTDTFPADGPAWQWLGAAGKDELEFVAVSTDGISSRNPGFIATGRELLSVKSGAGEFLRRRLSKAARGWQKDDTMPSDDLAVAGIWLRQEG